MLRTGLVVVLAAVCTALMAAAAWSAVPSSLVPPDAASVSANSAGGPPSNSAVRAALRSVTGDAHPASPVALEALPAGHLPTQLASRTVFEPAGLASAGRPAAASGLMVADEGSDTNLWALLTGVVLVMLVAARRGRRF